MTKSKKFMTGTLAAVALAVASLSVGSTAAEAKHKHHWHGKYWFYTAPLAVAPLAYYGYYNNCGYTWTKYGKTYVCY